MSSHGDFASLMESAASQTQDRASRRIERGQDVEGTVIQISGDAIFVDIGLTADARLERSALDDARGELSVKLGDRIRAKVLDPRSDAPVLAVSMGRGKGGLDVEDLRMAQQSGTPVEGVIKEAVKGGLEVEVGGRRAFCPASQVDVQYTADISVFVGQTSPFFVLEVRDQGRSIVLSRRAWLEAQRASQTAELRQRLTSGYEASGTVSATKNSGAVVDLGGIEGFVHISELARGRVRSVEDVVRVGDSVTVRVLTVEEGDRGLRVRLSLVTSQTPEVATPPARERVLEATVTGAGPAGLFVATELGDGFVPARELELAPGSDHRRVFPKGATLQVVALPPGADGRSRLSARRVRDVVERANYREFSQAGAAPAGALGSLGDLLRERLGLPESPTAAASAKAAPATPAGSKPAPPASSTTSRPDSGAGSGPSPAASTPGPRPVVPRSAAAAAVVRRRK